MAMAQGKGLGKGLGALLSAEGIPEETKDVVRELKINEIHPNREQPRKIFEDTSLQELAESIKESGVIQPIIVTKKNKEYQIVAGERRWRAARLAGMAVIPAIVRNLTDEQTMEQALIENIQRQDLNPLEEAFAMDNLMKVHGLTQEKLSKKLGKSRSAIANTIRLIALEESVQDYVRNGDLTAGHARSLLGISENEEQKKAAEFIIEKDLSVRETEEYVKKLLQPKKEPPLPAQEEVIPSAVTLSAKDVERDLTRRLGTKVKLKVKDQIKGKGAVVIDFYSYDDLNRVLELL